MRMKLSSVRTRPKSLFTFSLLNKSLRAVSVAQSFWRTKVAQRAVSTFQEDSVAPMARLHIILDKDIPEPKVPVENRAQRCLIAVIVFHGCGSGRIICTTHDSDNIIAVTTSASGSSRSRWRRRGCKGKGGCKGKESRPSGSQCREMRWGRWRGYWR